MKSFKELRTTFARFRYELGSDPTKRIIFLAVTVLAIPITVALVQRVAQYFTGAVVTTNILFSNTQDNKLTPTTTRTLQLTLQSSTNKVGFARVEVIFDKAKVKLSGEVTPTGPLKREVVRTSMAEANTTGKVILVYGLCSPTELASSTTCRNNPGTGTFVMANIPFTAVSTAQNDSAVIDIATSTGQLVDMTTTVIPYTKTAYTFSLNSSTSTGTPTPTSGTGVITNLSVKDTTNAADWSIQSNLQNGDLIYGDRTTQTFSNLPSTVLGQQWIRTAMDSKSFTGNPLVTFNVPQAATVYIGHQDAITSKPTWLSTWVDTGLNYNIGTNVISLFSKNFTAGALVSLGPNGGVESNSMYTVIVKPSSVATNTPTVTKAPTFTITPTKMPTFTVTPTKAPNTGTPTPTSVSGKVGDLDGDGDVDIFDFNILLTDYGKTGAPGFLPSDIDKDGDVDIFDFNILLTNYGK